MRSIFFVGLITCSIAVAYPAAQGRASATGKCNDGTYSTAQIERGACSGHDGVAEWYGKSGADTEPGSLQPKATSGVTLKRAPAGSTGRCEDGSFTMATSYQGACSSHGGVAEWLGKPLSTKEKSAAQRPVGTTGTIPTTPTQTARPRYLPKDATAECIDDTYSYAEHHQGACSGHGGVKVWFR